MILKDELANDKVLMNMLGKSMHEITDPDFDNKVMERISMAEVRKFAEKKNLRLSWIFLIISIVLLPVSYPFILKAVGTISGGIAGDYLQNFSEFLFPVGIILISVIVLLQIDNLIQLNIRRKTI